MPPTLVFKVKLTVAPGRGPPEESTTLKTTVEVSPSPVPFNPIVVGVAETNWIDPIAAAATVTVPVADRLCDPTVALAVIVSVPLHPLAVYVMEAMPVEVVIVPAGGGVPPLALARIVAWPFATQGELNVTVTGAAV